MVLSLPMGHVMATEEITDSMNINCTLQKKLHAADNNINVSRQNSTAKR